MASAHMQGQTLVKLGVNGFEHAGKRFFHSKCVLVVSVQTCQAKYKYQRWKYQRQDDDIDVLLLYCEQ